MVLIKNTQRTIKVNTRNLKQDAEKVLQLLGYDNYDLGIWLTTNKTIRNYNKQYRKRDKATDILSFAYHPKLKPGQQIQPKTDEDKNLGDLIISAERVKEDAQKYGATFSQRLQKMLVHGICHLLGYDHETDADFKVMQKKEKALLAKLK